MSKSIININNIDYSKEPCFFGPSESLGLQRYDQPKYNTLFNLFKQQISYSWRPEEINITKDKHDFEKLTDYDRFIFTKNLSYQILLDSVQSRGVAHLLENCTNPEIEAFCKAWEYFETIHSYSYTYIIKNVYNNPSKIFDEIVTDSEVLKRTISVTKYYDELIESTEDIVKEYNLAKNIIDLSVNNPQLKEVFPQYFDERFNEIEKQQEYAKKKSLYLTLVSINILEGIRFYVSFACSYSFAQNKKMTGNAKIISLINRDENLHMAFTTKLLRYLSDDESEGFKQIADDCREIVRNMYRDAANEEMEWAEYLFKDGAMIGLNAEILTQYMKWLTNTRMKSLKLEPVFPKISNPISWINNWTETKGVQEAPQEEEIISYTVGAINQDVDQMNLDEFNF